MFFFNFIVEFITEKRTQNICKRHTQSVQSIVSKDDVKLGVEILDGVLVTKLTNQ